MQACNWAHRCSYRYTVLKLYYENDVRLRFRTMVRFGEFGARRLLRFRPDHTSRVWSETACGHNLFVYSDWWNYKKKALYDWRGTFPSQRDVRTISYPDIGTLNLYKYSTPEYGVEYSTWWSPHTTRTTRPQGRRWSKNKFRLNWR